MDKEITGRIFDIQGFSVHDGPGIRTDIFLKGCPLRCLWCHSPESQAPEAQVAWFEMRCMGVDECGKCLDACPKEVLKKGPVLSPAEGKGSIQVVELDREACDNCGKCTEVCVARALSMAGTDMTVDEAMKAIEKDKAYYRKSGGGVTVSGGEPMTQHEFLLALLRECRSRGFHTCLDTSGYAKWDRYREVLEYVNLFLYDLKHMSSEIHRDLTAVPNELILENARRLAAAGAALQIRIPIIPGCNDSEANLRAAGAFCVELGEAVTMVQILPYHRLGSAKYARLHKEYRLETVVPPSDERMEECRSLLESYNLPVRIH